MLIGKAWFQLNCYYLSVFNLYLLLFYGNEKLIFLNYIVLRKYANFTMYIGLFALILPYNLDCPKRVAELKV